MDHSRWVEGREGPTPRYATIHLGPKEKPIELSVTMLGKEAAAILPNVNRWRGQLGLPPVDEAGLAALTKDIKVNDGTAVLVDMTGSAGKNAGGKMAAKRSFIYQKPEGWLEAAHPEMGTVPRKALFQVGEGAETAEVSVTTLPGRGDLMANVARWAGQVARRTSLPNRRPSSLRSPLAGGVAAHRLGWEEGAASLAPLSLPATKHGFSR